MLLKYYYRGMTCSFISFFLLTFFCCQKWTEFTYWPRNGAEFEDVIWELSIGDSANVLQKQDGLWILPEPDDTDAVKKIRTIHRKPEHSKAAKKVKGIQQEVLNPERGMVEYYGFQKGAVLLLGYSKGKDLEGLIVYDPPLVLIPGNPAEQKNPSKSSSLMKTWNQDSGAFKEGFTTHVTFQVLESDSVILDSLERPALLCEIIISSDRTIGFGGTDLIVPDAVMMKNKVMLVKGYGPVLEWGIRSRKTESEKIESDKDDHRLTPEESLLHEKRELYIEVTRHEPLK